MNNKLEVIGIDHGWSMMKTISQVFVTGVKEITRLTGNRQMSLSMSMNRRSRKQQKVPMLLVEVLVLNL